MTLIEIPNSESTFLVESPEVETSKAIIFLPGMSGSAFSERFQTFVNAGLSMGFAIVRISAWKNAKDIPQKSLAEIHSDVSYVIDYLHRHGFLSICAVGKSFGGTVLLTLSSQTRYVKKQVLWSPVIGIKEDGSNVDTLLSTALGSLNSLQDIYVDEAYMKNKDVHTLIIHGDADENISISNSEKLVSIMPNAQIVSIKGSDHSYSDKNHEKTLIEETLDFLSR